MRNVGIMMMAALMLVVGMRLANAQEAITFNSKLAFDVWTMNAEGKVMHIGKTPAAEPVRIPGGADWGITPLSGTKMEEAAGEVRAQSIPGLRLGNTTDGELAAVKDLQDLRVLDLSFTRVTDTGLVNLKEMKGLEMLKLPHQVTNAGLACVKEFKGLRMLSLTQSKVTDGGLVHLKELKELRTLELGLTQVTDAGLAQLKELKGLRSLSLGMTRVTGTGLGNLKELQELESLDLQGSPVTNAGLAQIEGLKGLKELNLWKTQVTDAGLAHLKGLKGLQWLGLEGGKVTEAGVQDLRKELPGCRISVSGARQK